MLENVKVGDWLAVPSKSQRWGNVPRIDQDIYRVERLTKTQAVCGRIRFRLNDGAEVGSGSCFDRAVPATSEMIEKREAQAAELKRYQSAKKRIKNLEDHAVVEIRKLNTAQLEALADAWEKVLAM